MCGTPAILAQVYMVRIPLPSSARRPDKISARYMMGMGGKKRLKLF